MIRQPAHRWYWRQFLIDIGMRPRVYEHISGLSLLVDYRPHWYVCWLWFARITHLRLRDYK